MAVLRRWIGCVLLMACVACATAPGDEDFAPVACENTDAVADAGFCDAPRELASEGPDSGVPRAFEACGPLVESTCGADDECLRDPGCVAADLLARFEPERCAEAAGDTRSFPPCTLGTCSLLTAKVCDSDIPGVCEDAPACAPARALETRASDGDESANASCAQALVDETLFPACG